jgi:uncharacterized membrane protein YhhN
MSFPVTFYIYVISCNILRLSFPVTFYAYVNSCIMLHLCQFLYHVTFMSFPVTFDIYVISVTFDMLPLLNTHVFPQLYMYIQFDNEYNYDCENLFM